VFLFRREGGRSHYVNWPFSFCSESIVLVSILLTVEIWILAIGIFQVEGTST